MLCGAQPHTPKFFPSPGNSFYSTLLNHVVSEMQFPPGSLSRQLQGVGLISSRTGAIAFSRPFITRRYRSYNLFTKDGNRPYGKRTLCIYQLLVYFMITFCSQHYTTDQFCGEISFFGSSMEDLMH